MVGRVVFAEAGVVLRNRGQWMCDYHHQYINYRNTHDHHCHINIDKYKHDHKHHNHDHFHHDHFHHGHVYEHNHNHCHNHGIDYIHYRYHHGHQYYHPHDRNHIHIYLHDNKPDDNDLRLPFRTRHLLDCLVCHEAGALLPGSG
mmetsp:Transcript_101607/g.217565  ORF Transcript_101607/g.217565 Transcript_101607/m.217565 type:complete len:144 (+) Transcript_101607:621-1052(+)